MNNYYFPFKFQFWENCKPCVKLPNIISILIFFKYFLHELSTSNHKQHIFSIGANWARESVRPIIGARSQKKSRRRKLTMVLSKEEERWRSVDLASHEPRHELTAACTVMVLLAARVIITKVAIILWRQQHSASSGLAQIRADRQHRERALTMPRAEHEAGNALDNTLIEVCGGTACLPLLWARLMLKEILFLQCRGVLCISRVCASFYLSHAPRTSADMWFQTHARCDFNESSLLIHDFPCVLSPDGIYVLIQSGSYSCAAPSRRRRAASSAALFRGDCILQILLRYTRRDSAEWSLGHARGQGSDAVPNRLYIIKLLH